ncbi:hypothetical protein TWF730_011173 [Orbilia blumenaviensis]|uniref:Uncharacterized protein n=1 Tax=Orbilia blumenaviensis TaxID=1796055 RepID=A0AAV9UJP9_9PEZI
MKYSIVLAALTAAVSSLPTPQLPPLINAGPFSLQLVAPGTELDGKFLTLRPTPANPENGKVLAITATSQDPNPHFDLTYNDPNIDPRFPPAGRLIYTPGAAPEECKFFLCPKGPVSAGYDEAFGPREYVRNNMKALFFPPSPSTAAPSAPEPPVEGGETSNGEPLKTWSDFQLDFLGYLTLNGVSNWWACPTKYPQGQDNIYTSVWWADGSVSDEKCTSVRVKRV